MCYPSPGPRCSSHARADKLEWTMRLTKVMTEKPEDHDAYMRARKGYEDAHNAWLRTPEGMEALERQGHHELAAEYRADRKAQIASINASPDKSGECADQELADNNLRNLATTSPTDVTKEMMTQYHNITPDTLKALAKYCPQVQAEVSKHPLTPSSALREITERALHYDYTHGQRAKGSDLSHEERETLANVANHRNADRHTMHMIANNAPLSVRNAINRSRTERGLRRVGLNG